MQRIPRRPAALVVTAMSFGLLAACSGGTSTPGASDGSSADDGDAVTAGLEYPSEASEDAACALAQEKGETEVAYRAATDADQFDEEIAGFEKKYPWLKVSFTSILPQESVQNVVAQSQTGHDLDVDANVLDPVNADIVFKQGLAQSYDWSKVGIDEDLLVTLDDVATFRSQRNLGGLAYNPSVISADELPDTWEELADAKYAGKVGYDPRGVFLSPLALAYGEEKTVDWFQKLVDDAKPQAVIGITVGIQQAASGEVPITTTGISSEVAQQQANGAPVEIKYLDVIPTQDTYEVLYKDAPHPYAAVCFLSWLGGPEGRAAREEVEHKVADSRPSFTPEGAELVYPESSEDLDLLADVTEQLVAIGGN